LKKAAEEVLGQLYVDVACHIESDSWTNYRNALMDGFRDYKNRLVSHEFDFKQIRQQIYKEYRKEIIDDLNQDLIADNQRLEKLLKDLQERDYSR
jgi:hypothetical protein